MDARIEVVGGADPAQDLASLHEWLAGESALRGRVRRDRLPPPKDTMGGGDILVAAVGAGGMLSVLAGTLVTWLTTRRDKDVERVRIRISGPDGRSVELDVRSREVEALLGTVLPVLRDGPS